MNIKITHNWLLEYLDTDATPYEIQKYLSLCGPSIESVTKIGNDFIYDIEVISNRIDYASLIGIAREAATILPMFGKKAKLKKDYLTYDRGIDNNSHLKLEIIDPENLCPRKLAIIMDVEIGDSPKYIKERLENCGIRSLNNLIDTTNYVMLEVGYPAHVFDYDRVKTGKIFIRKAKKGEKITTLDKKNYLLNSNDIIFDDGTGRIIDLPGIMGLDNSVVTEKTKKIIFWIETNDPKAIRRTSMRLGIRTAAASMNEKNPDSEVAKMTFLKGIELYKKIANGKIVSPLYDTAPEPEKQKMLSMKYEIFDKLIGVKIERDKINNILRNLGFEIASSSFDKFRTPRNDKQQSLSVKIPSYRKYDISIPEDLVEEVARIYGYHKLPNNLPPPANVQQPQELEKLFTITSKIKYFLKHLGLTETVNYSMISKELIEELNLNIRDHLRLANTISNEIEYMRISLLPSLYKNLKDNTGRKDIMRFFEISKVYYPKKNDLPNEVYKLGIGVNTDYFDLKGIVEVLYKELNIESDLKEKIINKDIFYLVELDLDFLIKNYQMIAPYKQINPYAVIKLDKTFTISPHITYEVIRQKAFLSKLLQKMDMVSLYENKLTLRFYYSSPNRNITEEEAKTELDRVIH